MVSCEKQLPYTKLEGRTMGTTYHMTIQSDKGNMLQLSIDSLLEAFNMELSTYISSSTISQFNQSPSGIKLSKSTSPNFYEMMIRSREIHEITEGAFDPSIGPLVEYYGFGTDKKNPAVLNDPDLFEITKDLVGFSKINMTEDGDSFTLTKANPDMLIDFSSIAKGYGVDLLCYLLEARGITNYLVEIGGESRASGVNAKGNIWTLGINTPDPGATLSEFISIVSLKDKALATSGNYRNFYNVDSITYVHIIDPISGMSRPSDILSATILADDCATADALATASIVLGAERAMELIDNMDGIDACFVIAPGGKYQLKYSKDYKKFINE